jgi:hypothetical protein
LAVSVVDSVAIHNPFAIAVFFMWVAFRIIRELNRIEGRLKEIRDRLPRA